MLKKIVIAIVLVVIVATVWYAFFAEHVTYSISSSSPDNLYRCEVTEYSGPYQSRAEIVFCDLDQNETTYKHIQNDSCRRSSYSVNWEYDSKHRTTGVVVYGDFDKALFPKTILFERHFHASASSAPATQGS